MQSHKFPPDLLFVLYGATSLAALGLAATYVRLPAGKAVLRWNRYGYTLYLWQNIFFIVVGMVCATGVFETVAGIIPFGGMVLSGLMVFCLATGASYVLPRIETAVTGRVERGFAAIGRILRTRLSASDA